MTDFKNVKKIRQVNVHARFTPDGPEKQDGLVFLEFLGAAGDSILEMEKKDQHARRVRLNKLRHAMPKTQPLFAKVFSDAAPPESVADEIHKLVPDKTLLREVFDIWAKAVKTTPEQQAIEKADIKRREKEIAQADRLFKGRKEIHAGLRIHYQAALAGNVEAAKYLYDSATEAVSLLQDLESKKLAMMAGIAAQETVWPVFADYNAGWEISVLERMKRLKMGADLSKYLIRLNAPRGTDLNLPARRWAKAAVLTIETTKVRCMSMGALIQNFGSAEAMAEFCEQSGWEYGKLPVWFLEGVKLPAFTQASLPAWKSVIRKMVRDQFPGFENHPDWQTQRNSAIARGRSTRGEVQNAILDDIVSALKPIAPASDLPKSAC